jgi:hypothetical protein
VTAKKPITPNVDLVGEPVLPVLQLRPVVVENGAVGGGAEVGQGAKDDLLEECNGDLYLFKIGHKKCASNEAPCSSGPCTWVGRGGRTNGSRKGARRI